ncbi:MAG: hypothetical protein JOY57_03965 [Actinobacteria bacterium]|nr:hypothetical protein [Actinomycetota bacterium]
MTRRHAIAVGSCIWAAAGAAVAYSALGSVDGDARLIVALASTLGPLAAAAAAWLTVRGRIRAAGALLLVSVLTPTYFAYVLNLPALVVGLALVLAPRSVPIGTDRGARSAASPS